MQALIKEMNGGGVDAVFIMDGANPAYDLPNSDQFVGLLRRALSFFCIHL